MLGKLPDDVLLSILKRLDLGAAVRSSILSRRWRHLPSVLPDIALDVRSFKPNHDDGFKRIGPDTVCSNMALAWAAKSILARRSHQPIANLSLTFYMRKESIDIVRAVEDAMSAHGRGVVAAKFTIVGQKIDFTCTDRDMIRQGELFLSYFDTCPRAFAGLTGLHVESVKLRDADIPDVLRTCQKLEWLSLLNCETDPKRALILEHPRLTELKLVTCNCDGVELKWLPKLSQVTCQSWFPSRHGCPLLFGHVPRLCRLMLSTAGYAHYTTLKLSKLLVNCAMLGELHLDFQAYRIWVQPENPRQLSPLLQNLRVLNLGNIFEECDLTWTFFMLQAAPLLNTLQIKVSSHECTPMDEMLSTLHGICKKENMKLEFSDFKHSYLAVLEITGFLPEDKFMVYIRRVMKAAVNLEQIDLHDDWCADCGFRPVATKYPRTKEERDKIRKQINEGIMLPVKTVRF